MTLEQLNKRIQTTTDLRNIVSTMKMLSSVSVAQYTHAETGLLQYTETLLDGFKALAVNNGLSVQSSISRQEKGKKQKALILLIGSDNGLVGLFNKSILIHADKFMKEQHLSRNETPCICLGRRLCSMAQYEKFHLMHSFPIAHNLNEIAGSASNLISLIQEKLVKDGIIRVVAFSNVRKNDSTYVHMQQLIPVTLPTLSQEEKRIWEGKSFPLISMSNEDFLKSLIHEYIVTLLSKTIVSSLASEHFIRMMHMQQSEKNIDESLEEMNLIYAQERQTNITNELIDIVSGANSIKKKKKSHISTLTNPKKNDKTKHHMKGVIYD